MNSGLIVYSNIRKKNRKVAKNEILKINKND